MRIAVVGMGFVGLVTATVLADRGNTVTCIDINEKRIDWLKKGDLYIYEPLLRELLLKNKTRVDFSSDYSNIKGNEVAFICVPTPTVDGRIDLSYVRSAVLSAKSVDSDVIITVKSTVVPGTASALSSHIGRDIVSNPEFLREGNAIDDTIHPNRIVIGGKNSDYLEKVKRIWEFTGAPVILTTNENAELIKYGSNSFLATKISFINEIANLCENIPGTDVATVAQGMGMDHRIGKDFLRAGIGFGGSCLPKDTTALVSYAKERGVELKIIKSAIDVNNERIEHAVEMIKKELGNLNGKNVCVLGISFKEDTNDVRESKSLELINALMSMGAKIQAYDPSVKEVDGVEMVGKIEELTQCDCVVIASEWKEFETNAIYEKSKKVIDLKRVVNIQTHPTVLRIGAYNAKD
ncbi:MAG: UDP-glucose/GDP-mannose dehydrogenase family protein [Thermoplasmatales archaeon]|nr:UDP-glucose/GDP-mannose dehydrogenase family protein [Thermoplasmatales archaeon]